MEESYKEAFKDKWNAKRYGALARYDESIGRFDEFLDKEGVRENTTDPPAHDRRPARESRVAEPGRLGGGTS